MDATKYKDALSMCQIYLRGQESGSSSAHTSFAIQQAVKAITAMPNFSAVDRERLSADLEMRFTIYAPSHQTLGMDTNHTTWLPPKRSHREPIEQTLAGRPITWRYWDRYRLYLEKDLAEASVRSVEDVTNDILSRLEDPARSGNWDRRGLVMGDVQSGKTNNYCGVICKAADAGYKVIIVLAGIHNNLRAQTQIALDKGFLGFTSTPRTGENQNAFHGVGVGELDKALRANTGTSRSHDFHQSVARQFGISPGTVPLLFVVKKNVTVLNNLLGWIRSSADAQDSETGRSFVRNVPLLVIDDEADLASIDTTQSVLDEDGKPDLEHDPTRINQLIRKILRSFGQAAYIGYTATPFANIFIHDRGTTRELGADLFPRNFVVLIPPPSNYLSPARVFGVEADEDARVDAVESLPLVRIVSDHASSNAIDEQHGWMPPKLSARTGHIPLYNGENRVPSSVIEAMMGFILTVAVRSLRESEPHHNSMLIHVARYTLVQAKVAEQVRRALSDIVQRLRLGDGDRTPTIQNEFHDLWFRDFVPTSNECHRIAGKDAVPSLHEWEKVASLLLKVGASIQVKTINGSAVDVLEYEERPINVIVIGGDKLSRGMTLFGLSVSYFLRASRMYDTLLQMGRWFGYRDKYLDLCRLYTTDELQGWFADIAMANEQLKADFRRMADAQGTPEDFGLKVRSHPKMLPTAAVKMRHGTPMSFAGSGQVHDFRWFRRDPAWIARNFSVVEDWLAARTRGPEKIKNPNGYLWHGVGAREILDLIAAYSPHERYEVPHLALGKYIKKKFEENELLDWKILLCLAEDNKPTYARIAGRDIGLLNRNPYPREQETEDPLRIKENPIRLNQLTSPLEESVDLTDEQKKEALKLTVDHWRGSSHRADRPQPTTIGRIEARAVRPRTQGLLLLYPLNPFSYAGLPPDTKPIIGMAVSFPKSRNEDPIEIIGNNIFTQIGGDDESF